MELHRAVDLGREAIMAGALLAAPVLLVSLVVGVLVSVLQAATQLQEHAISFVPKLFAVLGVLTVALPWLMEQMLDYSRHIIQEIPPTLWGG